MNTTITTTTTTTFRARLQSSWGIDHACGYCSFVGHIICEIVVIENHNYYLSQSVTFMIQVVSES